MDLKRKASVSGNQNSEQPNLSSNSSLIKRTKIDEEPAKIQTLTTSVKTSNVLSKSVKYQVTRSSSLEAPNMLLSGHEGDVFSCKFSPSGENIASCSMDRSILLWKTFKDCKNYGIIKPHNNAILQVLWSQDGQRIYSASADKTVAISDAVTGARIKKFKGHLGIIWDSRKKNSVSSLENGLPVTSVSCSLNGDVLFSGSLDNTITAWDMRKNTVLYKLVGHTDTITGLDVSPKTGNSLISSSDDSTLILWDIRPFCSNPTRISNIFFGAPHSSPGHTLIRPAFSKDESRIASGGSDRCTTIWDLNSTKLIYKLPGHKGTVTQVDFHPVEPIILSCSADRTMFLGELDSSAVIEKA
ncbi:hypothetical protein BB560_004601 [Smittium megazygosporum]|uniref:Uncharacterized protein n=1 Tax=Smittium megazygosporum TaxID=133381 RepID=A0A2T9Z8S5_9FUNG|nr:hypothetical protein BB560_004601 [Smittium megazygosporum]